MRRPFLTVVHDGQADGEFFDYRGVLSRSGLAEQVEVQTYTGRDICADRDLLPANSVTWLVLSDTAGSMLTQLIEPLQQRHNAILMTRRQERLKLGEVFVPGVVTCPPETPEGVMAGMLQALVSHVAMIETLAVELKLMQMASQGVREQIGRMDDELRLAARLQREFLPASTPTFDHVAFSVLWRPASYVSGDIYDIKRLDEDHVGLFIADAVGHGVPAALMTMFIKQSLMTKVIDPGEKKGYRLTEPAEALARMNRDLATSGQSESYARFASACYAVLNIRTLELKIARAGHPYPILFRKDGVTKELDPDGGLLALFPEETFEQMRVFLDPGDRLLLYSDGFEMAFADNASNNNETAGSRTRVASDAYRDEFELLRQGPVEPAMQQLMDRLDHASGSLNQRDDLTLICVSTQ